MKQSRAIIFGTAICLISLLWSVKSELNTVYKAWSLFAPDRIVENFRTMDQHFLSQKLVKSKIPLLLEHKPETLPKRYRFETETKSVQDFLEESWTTGLIVIRDGIVRHESYAQGQKPSDRTMGWSLSKSFISALIGMAHEDGLIPDLGQTMGFYTPNLRNSAYAEVSVQDVLEMSTGIAFDENYAHPLSDINLLGYFMALGWSMDSYMLTLKPEEAAGQRFRYMSPNTQALGMLLRSVTGKPVSQLFQERLWQPMGAEHDAYWLRDRNHVDLALGGLNASLRDFAKLGLLYLNQGYLNQRQILSPSWVARSTQSQKQHLKAPIDSDTRGWGYGFQWWLPPGQERDGDYCAIGIYGEFIYINPRYRTVIAKTSAYPHYNEDGGLKELETIAVFRALARQSSPDRLARQEEIR